MVYQIDWRCQPKQYGLDQLSPVYTGNIYTWELSRDRDITLNQPEEYGHMKEQHSKNM